MIVLLAATGDVHAVRVAQEIEARGHRALVLDCRGAGEGLEASLHYARSTTAAWVRPIGEEAPVRLTDVRAVWNRRPAVPGNPIGVLDEDHVWFARQEWQHLMDGLLLTLGLHARVVNPLPAQRAAVKPYQLAVARTIGLRVPDTLMTSDPQAALDFVEARAGRVIHKVMTSPRNAFLDTQEWRTEHSSLLGQLPLAPTVFQEFVEGPLDIRATVVGSEIFAASFETARSRGGIDSRLDLDVPTAKYELPQLVSDQLHALMDALGLAFATADFKVDSAGDLHFLELNPQGQFLYVEILTGQPIASAVAQLLLAAT